MKLMNWMNWTNELELCVHVAGENRFHCIDNLRLHLAALEGRSNVSILPLAEQ